jgi:hypothetical protein
LYFFYDLRDFAFVEGERKVILTFGRNPSLLWIFFSFDSRHVVLKILPRLNALI